MADTPASLAAELSSLILDVKAAQRDAERAVGYLDAIAIEAQELSSRIAALPIPSQPPTPPPPPTTAAKYFSPRSNWNTPIPLGPALAPNSAAIVQRIAALKPGTQTIQLNQSSWAVNVAVAPRGFSGPRVTARNPDGWTMNGVPMLADAVGTPDTDGHLLIIDWDRNSGWNFQGNTRNTGSGYTAGAMGVFRLDGPGWYNPNLGGPWTGRSSNACLLGGLIFPDELRAGVIPHALSIGLDGSLLERSAVMPAYTTDPSSIPSGTGVPNGTRLQLDPSLNLDTLNLGREAKIIARAMQVYGVFVVERTSGIALYFRSTHNGGASYAGMNFSGLNGNLLARMRVIAPAASYEYDYPARFSPAQPFRG